MDLHLADSTVLLLGAGDELDRAILRALASEGAWTYATTVSASTTDLTQHSDTASHWVAVEDDVNAFTVGRINNFLTARGRPATSIILHVDVISALGSRGPIRWWRLRSEAKSVMRSASEVLSGATPSKDRSLLLLYQLNHHAELASASRWLQRTMSAILKRALPGARVNSILVGPGGVDPDAAAMIAMLCSPVSRRVAGALIPMDDGALARDFAQFDF
ncbi:hypothetical protein PUW79_11895 [Microbacterium sp. NE2HP2]|uniref:hypothetical protein n=1 Tax=Microbacterium TaxID=33882 RepID=UPI002365C616|nr:hypothetical protein [Microbacterium plantarum]MDD7945335.1 hypothetical protein [Microbacterium plantarum]